jgi:hypothetical protein
VLRVAASLAAGVPVELGAALGGLDAPSTALVARAVLAAAGARGCVTVDDPPYPPGVRVVGAEGGAVAVAGPVRGGEHR